MTGGQDTMSFPNRNARSVMIGWLVVFLIVAALPLEAAVYLYSGSEPYPALNQPPFMTVYGAGGTFSGEATSLSVVLADGSVVPLSSKALFSESMNQAPFVIDSIVARPDLDARSRENLRAELASLLPGREIWYLRIDKQRREYRIGENRRYPLADADVTIVDLRDRREVDS